MQLKTPEKQSVIFPGALGDFICFLPALTALSETADVDLFARSDFVEIVPARVCVHSIDRYEIARLFAAGAAEDERVLSLFSNYSTVYSWHGSRSTEFVGALQLLGKRALVFPFYPAERGVHQARYFLSCVSDEELTPLPAIPIGPDAIAWADRYLRRNVRTDQPILGIAPGSGAPEKNWPAENFAQLGRWWREEIHGTVLVFAGPAEEKRTDLEPLRAGALVAENLPLGALAALLQRLDVYVGNDSGVTHLGAAVGVSTVALFGPSAVSQWAPRGPRVSIISQNVECSPCSRSAMKSCQHRMCLSRIDVPEVITRIRGFISVPNLTRVNAATRV